MMKNKPKLTYFSTSFTGLYTQEELYHDIKKVWEKKFEELCEKHSIFKKLDFFELNDSKRNIIIHPPENWMTNELFLLFIFQNDGYTLDDSRFNLSRKIGFEDMSLSSIRDHEKKDLFRFTNEILKISERMDTGTEYALISTWYLEDDEGTYECENEVSYNPGGNTVDGKQPIHDGEFPYSAYDQEYVRNDDED
tara:strand:- start:284 stop:865 length:582 start_codon:yes stop_codon:yes gene_type:complete